MIFEIVILQQNRFVDYLRFLFAVILEPPQENARGRDRTG